MTKTNDELLKEAVTHIHALEAELERLTTPPHTLATVCSVIPHKSGDRLLLASGGGWPTLVPAPTDPKLKKLLKPSSLVSVHPMTGAIVDVFDQQLPGVEATVKRVFDGSPMIEVDGGGGTTMIYKGAVAVKAGDTVLLDRTGQVVLRTVAKDRTAYSVETATGVRWCDIGGQEEAKRVLAEVLEDPIKHAALHEGYGKRPVKGVLLYGPPGTGKTLLAKAAANAIRELHGKAESSSAFIYVKGPEILNMWVGNSEAQIRALFARAKEHKIEHGYPALIFIDEADALLGKRDSHHASTLSSTIVPMFLAEMDGMADSGAFVMLATNRPDILDPAITRDGRIDRKISVGRPDVHAAEQIFTLYLAKTKTQDAVARLAKNAATALFSDMYPLYNVGIQGQGVTKLHLHHMASGAMLAGIVDMAVSIAIARDVKAGTKRPSGVMMKDMEDAVMQVFMANRRLNHDDDVLHFVESMGYTAQQVNVVQRIAA